MNMENRNDSGVNVLPIQSGNIFLSLARWFDSYQGNYLIEKNKKKGVDWVRCIPFIAAHLMCFGVIWVGWSWAAVSIAAILYAVRMFAITGFYHRYFSHRSFKTSRWFQFIFAVIGSAAVQRGPLWWAAHHRNHHRFSDKKEDIHSPDRQGFLWSHMVWFLCRENFPTDLKTVRDWRRFPELVFLDRFDVVIPVAFAFSLFGLGVFLEAYAPGLGVTGGQILIWGFFISTIVLYHCTYCINSLAHRFGNKRFITGDESRNSFLLALVTFGEGWHNNHHHYPASVRQGFYWWELDLTYYGLLFFSKIGLIWDLKPVPSRVMSQNLIQNPLSESRRKGAVTPVKEFLFERKRMLNAFFRTVEKS